MDNDLRFENLDEFEPLMPQWLWYPLIPRSMITILEGDPGLGKSFITAWLAARISTGGNLPNGEALSKGRAIIASTEDDASYTIRPRIEAMGGDASRIRVIDSYRPFDEEGLRALAEEIVDTKPDLLVIDPLNGFLPAGADGSKANRLRQLLFNITEIAAEVEAAVIVIRHLSKEKRTSAVSQGSGIMDIIASARSGLRVGEHPTDAGVFVVAHFKQNVGPRGPTFAYRIVDQGRNKQPMFEWLGESDVTAIDLQSATGGNKPIKDAEQLLKRRLKSGPVPSAELIKEAKEAEIAERTLRRAKKKLKIRSTKIDGKWHWRLRKMAKR